jgi:protein-tyrosine phosphatase
LDLLLSFAKSTPVREVPDPYFYRDPAGFERVFDIIEEGVAGLMAHLRTRHSANL